MASVSADGVFFDCAEVEFLFEAVVFVSAWSARDFFVFVCVVFVCVVGDSEGVAAVFAGDYSVGFFGSLVGPDVVGFVDWVVGLLSAWVGGVDDDSACSEDFDRAFGGFVVSVADCYEVAVGGCQAAFDSLSFVFVEYLVGFTAFFVFDSVVVGSVCVFGVFLDFGCFVEVDSARGWFDEADAIGGELYEVGFGFVSVDFGCFAAFCFGADFVAEAGVGAALAVFSSVRVGRVVAGELDGAADGCV